MKPPMLKLVHNFRQNRSMGAYEKATTRKK